MLYLWLGVLALLAALVEIANGGFLADGYLRLGLLGSISTGSLWLSSVTWGDRR
jgi:hypothetical protein